MSRKEITPPAALAVAFDDVRMDLAEPDPLKNPQIEALIKAVTREAEHKTGRALIYQTWQLTLDEFGDALRLDGAPLSSVTSIQYLDASEVLQTLNPVDYYVDALTEPGYVVPASGKAWPETAPLPNAVRVLYVSGYGADDSAVPDEIKQYIRAKVVEQFDSAPGNKPHTSDFTDRLLDRCKVYQ